MKKDVETVQEFYDAQVEHEWNRIAGKPEFLLTCRMLDRYINPGDKVLDIGGGPGRYSLYLAKKGCDVTLLDLSPENTKFAAAQAAGQNLAIKTVAGDATEADKTLSQKWSSGNRAKSCRSWSNFRSKKCTCSGRKAFCRPARATSCRSQRKSSKRG